MTTDPLGVTATLDVSGSSYRYWSLTALENKGWTQLDAMPYSIRVLLESVLRNQDGLAVTEDDLRNLCAYDATNVAGEVPYKPARVVLQDFTGVPAVCDLAALRNAVANMGGDPAKINPLVRTDLVIDHSVQVDNFGSDDALAKNVTIEYQRNRERYEFLRWGQQAFENFAVVPPSQGIIHQVNLEFLAGVVSTETVDGQAIAYPDTLVGTDSHTVMINGVGVLGWGVGGIEAEAALLGQPIAILTPEVVGFELTGKLPPATTATDLVLTVTQMLRAHGVVGKFVEFYGSGVAGLRLADRATIANMAPEYGATMGFFPVDGETLRYLRDTGRTEEQVALVEAYCKAQKLWRGDDAPTPTYSSTLSLDMGTVGPCLAGPKRPQDRITLDAMNSTFERDLKATFNVEGDARNVQRSVTLGDTTSEIGHGAVVIAAITSCTNTSNPAVLIAAGLLAKAAHERGIKVKPWVKTSLAPGSRVVTSYLEKAGLLDHLEALGFHVVGYGCTTCIGNSGPLPDAVREAILDGDLVACSVLSGNRNFEGRISPHIKANYLASPPLVVAYALAGRLDVDLSEMVLGTDGEGNDVFLRDLWPDPEEIHATIDAILGPDLFREQYGSAYEGDMNWRALPTPDGQLYPWQANSTYIQEPPFWQNITSEVPSIEPISGARAIAKVGDSVTTDHISPAGAIAPSSPAGQYLQNNGVTPKNFNSYGSRRGNHEVMMRGTFANVRLRNQLAPGTEGGFAPYWKTGEVTSMYEACTQYQADGTPLVVLAGREYGTGSSRDWAAKGTYLLGIQAVIAESYERIHRSNLVGMGVLPLEFPQGQSADSLGLDGQETFSIAGLSNDLQPRSKVKVTATGTDGSTTEFDALVRIDSPIEVEYYRHGGILTYVLRKLIAEA